MIFKRPLKISMFLKRPFKIVNGLGGNHHHWMFFGTLTIAIDGLSMIFGSPNHWFKRFSMVKDHLSNYGMVLMEYFDGMVSMERSGLMMNIGWRLFIIIIIHHHNNHHNNHHNHHDNPHRNHHQNHHTSQWSSFIIIFIIIIMIIIIIRWKLFSCLVLLGRKVQKKTWSRRRRGTGEHHWHHIHPEHHHHHCHYHYCERHGAGGWEE